MRESGAWLTLKTGVERAGGLHIERIEAKSPEGLPDTVWTHRTFGISGWLELKYVKSEGEVLIPWSSPAQPLWLARWARNGGRAGLLMRRGATLWTYWPAKPSLDWIRDMKTAAAWRCEHTDVQDWTHLISLLVRGGLARSSTAL